MEELQNPLEKNEKQKNLLDPMEPILNYLNTTENISITRFLIALINVGSLLESQEPGMKPILFHYLKKGKQNVCCNYRDISLLNTGYKIYTKILNTRLQTVTGAILLENQSGFRKGRFCIDTVFALKQIIEK
jgi:hypothetical protein